MNASTPASGKAAALRARRSASSGIECSSRLEVDGDAVRARYARDQATVAAAEVEIGVAAGDGNAAQLDVLEPGRQHGSHDAQAAVKTVGQYAEQGLQHKQ